MSGDFDFDKIPRLDLLAEAFPGQAIDWRGDDLVTVRCTLPGCAHRNGDQHPSLKVNPTTGWFRCFVPTGRQGGGWKDFVTTWFGEARWRQIARACLPERREESLEACWARLEREDSWTELYRIAPELAARYLRAGRRYPRDPYCASAIGIWVDGTLHGIKFRLPKGARWADGSTEKYRLTKGSKVAGLLLGRDRARDGAALVWVAGEKDWLVASSHLDPARWAPVTGVAGEGTVPRGARAACQGRNVVIAYDPDDAGRAGAAGLARALDGAALSIRVAVLPAGETPLGTKFDVADVCLYLTPAALVQALEAAGPMPADWRAPARVPADDDDGPAAPPDAPAEEPADEGEDNEATRLADFAEARAQLFQDDRGETFASVDVAGRHVTVSLNGPAFRGWLTDAYRREHRRVVAPSAVAAALVAIQGAALFNGTPEPVHFRVANLGDGRVYLDLGDPTWRAVEVDAQGWRIVERPPVRFRRKRGMLPLPEPVRGGSVEELWPLLNVQEERDWILAKGWLVGALRGEGPCYALLLQGEQGSGKSTVSLILRSMIDPNAVPIAAVPKEERDLLIAAEGSWILGFDNLSGCPGWLSDALCRIATGGGFRTRELYANDEEKLFWSIRPIILNGIDDLATRPDLADRSLLVRLPEVAEEDRREERALMRAVAEVRPRVLGALLDAVSCALRRLPTIKLARLPRMADAATWITAASPALGLPDAAWLEVLDANRVDQDLVGIEADPVASAVRALAADRAYWHGSARELLALLTERAEDQTKRQKGWPKTEGHLSSRVTRVAPVLRRLGVEVRKLREGNVRTLVIRRAGVGIEAEE